MMLSELLEAWQAGADGGPVAISLHRELIDVEVVAHFTVDGEPQSKSRARVTMKHGNATAYTPRQTALAEGVIGWKFRECRIAGSLADGTATFGVFASFFCGTRQRRDVDNMIKLILDGLNGVAWKDDAQVTEVSGKVRRGVPKEEARTEIVIYKTNTDATGGLTETKACEHCGGSIRVYPSTSHMRFCSPQCKGLSQRNFVTRDCAQCGKPTKGGAEFCSVGCLSASRRVSVACTECGRSVSRLKYHVRQRNFCSPACAARYSRARGVRHSKGVCQDCGGAVSRREYRRCQACSIESRRGDSWRSRALTHEPRSSG